MRTSNPILNSKAMSSHSWAAGEGMTAKGTVNKSFILFFLLLFSASWVWGKVIRPATTLEYEWAAAQTIAGVRPWMMVGLFGGFITAMITVFQMHLSRITAPIYALFEGLFLGGLSAMFEMRYPGIVMQAVGLTFGTLFCMLTAYRTGFVKVTDKFRMGVVAATGAIALVYFISMIMSFFGASMPMIHSSGPIGIGFSLVVVGIAALNLVLDFDIIDRLSRQGAPKYMEWYGAFALMVTLVWLYIEILRLLSKLNSRR